MAIAPALPVGTPANEPLPPPTSSTPASPPRMGTVRGVPLMTNGILHDPEPPASTPLTDDASGRLTAIFRPESSDAWRSQLRDAHERSEQQRAAKPADVEMAGTDEVDEAAKPERESGEQRLWRARKTLRRCAHDLRPLD